MSIADIANYCAVASAIGFAYFLGRRNAYAHVERELSRRWFADATDRKDEK